MIREASIRKKQRGRVKTQKTNTITINGRTYDTTTGSAIDIIINPSQHSSPKKPTPVRVIVKPTKHKAKQITVHDSSHRNPAQTATKIHVRAERPKTLMRTSVKKPSAPKPLVHASGLVSQPRHKIVHGSSTKREQRSTQIMQSKHISKFKHPHKGVTKKTAAIAVKEVPSGQTAGIKALYDIADTPPSLHTPTLAKQIHVPQSIFESALATATTHQAKPYKQQRSPKKRAIRLGASALTVLLLVSFFAYQNVPRMTLRAAASTIGFNASVPGYSPAGFGLNGPIRYQPGQVILSFRSHSDDRSYTLTQAKLDLNPDTWANDYLSTTNQTYQIRNIDDKKVYIYNQSNATWTHNGIWFNVQGDAGLSTDQLLHIASSI